MQFKIRIKGTRLKRQRVKIVLCLTKGRYVGQYHRSWYITTTIAGFIYCDQYSNWHVGQTIRDTTNSNGISYLVRRDRCVGKAVHRKLAFFFCTCVCASNAVAIEDAQLPRTHTFFFLVCTHTTQQHQQHPLLSS